MSTLDDWNYLRLSLETRDKPDRLPYEVNRAIQKRLALFFRRTGRAIRRVLMNFSQFLGDLVRQSPESHNGNARKTPYDYIHVRGLR